MPPLSAVALMALLSLTGPAAAAEGGGSNSAASETNRPAPAEGKAGEPLTIEAINGASFAPPETASGPAKPEADKTREKPARDKPARSKKGGQADAASGKESAKDSARDQAKDKRPEALLVKVQVLLDRAHFSPGAIDGRDGENMRGALSAFAEAQGLPPTKTLTRELFDKLAAPGGEPVAMAYTVTEADVAGPFVETIPAKMEAQADLEAMSYTNVREMLAERFHMARDLLSALNPDAAFDKAGTVVTVAAVSPLETGKPKTEAKSESKSDAKRGDKGDGKAKSETRGKAGKPAKDREPEKSAAAEKDRPGEAKDPASPEAPAKDVVRIEVDKTTRHVRAFDKAGALKAYYPASIGSEEKPAPSGDATVKGVAFAPWYTYNPKYRFKGVKAKTKFSIHPGPNNPVGVVWIDLSIPSYGIHGTPEPEKVGKTESHGCIRLTNWDARDLAQRVERGAKVEFKDD